jgi:DNA-binding Lrp family transcriptional regulator
MKGITKLQILEIARKTGGVRPEDLATALGISKSAIHRHLRRLVESGQLKKQGTSPYVVYLISEASKVSAKSEIDHRFSEVIENNYIFFTPDGRELLGVDGFLYFLKQTKQDKDLDARAKEYCSIIKSAEEHRTKDGLIDGTGKISQTFDEIFLEHIYYSDFYSLPKYGKTQLGQYLLHGKSGQNRKLIRMIFELTKNDVHQIIKVHKIEALAFIPHSIPRKISFLNEFKKLLSLNLPEIKLAKAYAGNVAIAQKSLSKLSERIENAQNTIFVKKSAEYKRILIIDDALGSGATMNEVARKIKTPTTKVYGYAIVGSMKGFEVIKEI